MSEEPYDRDEALDAFNRILDEMFGATPRSDDESREFFDRADHWFRTAYMQFRSDLEEMIEAVPDAMESELSDMDFDETAVMDVWIDGRHYELSITRLPDDDEPVIPLLPPPAPTPDSEMPSFSDEFVEEWA